jgi:hypothetical protein
MQRSTVHWATIVLFLACTPVVLAQLNRATLTGFVADPSGAAVANARIVAVQKETNLSSNTVTTEAGLFTLPALDIGTYRVTAEAPGFKRSVRDDLVLNAGATVRLEFALEIGSISESVEVRAQSSAIEVDSTRVATSLTTKLVEDLPLVVAGQIRNVFNLAIIAPEVKTGNGYRIGGGQGSGWEMTMDGTSLTSASTQYQTERAPISSVPVDAIAEFNVESSGMKAEYGRSMGVISFATKAGSNELHGNAFEFLRNNVFDARNFFANRAPILKQHDFGFTVGGPVVLPKIYNGRNKTFFFASYEGFRNRSGNSPSYSTIPLPEMYQGDFHNYIRNDQFGRPFMMQLYDPATTTLQADGKTYTRTPFAGNLIPQSRFSTVAKNYIALRPAELVPNVPGSGINQNFYRAAGSTIQPWNKYSVRFDHQIGAKHRTSFLWMDGTRNDDFGPDGPPGLPVPFNGGQIWYRKNRSGRATWDYTISPRVLNSFRFTMQREAGGGYTINSKDPNAGWGAKIGIKNAPGPDRALTPVTFSGYTGWSSAFWGYDRGKDLNITDDITFTVGRHTFKGGFFYAHNQWWGGGQHRPNGSFDFNATATSIPGDGSGNTGNGFASFLLGQAYQWGLETPRAVIQIWQYVGGFFQDDWRVNNKLTVNMGLRWEYTTPVTGGAVLDVANWEDFGSYGEPAGFMNFDPSVPNPKLGGILGATTYTGDCSECTGQTSPFVGYKKAWSPRLGLAYQVRPGTVIRAYGGISYGAVKTTGGSTHFQGLILNSTFNNSGLPPFTYFNIDNGLPPWTKPPFRGPTTDLGGTTYFWQKHDSGRPSEFYTWNLDIQHQMPGNMVASAGYTGTKGAHLASAILNINQMDPRYFTQYGRDLLVASVTSPAAVAAGIKVPYAGFTGSVAQALKPFPGWTDVATSGGQPSSIGERAGSSSYHALILKLDKRYSSGLTLLSSYVFSKMFSNADTTAVPGRNVMDHYNRGLEKALSFDDQTHVFREAFSYDLPFGSGRRWMQDGLASHIFGGWGIAGFLEYASGTPMNVNPGITSVPGGAGNRVLITSYDNWRAPVSGSKFDPFKDVWWNKAAFGVDANGRQMTSTEILYAGFGNATRNNPKVRTPWLLNENFSVSKNFPITERIKLTFRAEAFNIFNRFRLGGPDSNFVSASFGNIRSQGNDPRRMQFALKLAF